MRDDELARHLIACLDLTNLAEDCTERDVAALVARAETAFGPVAAICIWPRFVAFARPMLPQGMRLATVVNFPQGDADIADTVAETEKAIADGADEIDLVIDYRSNDWSHVREQVAATKQAAQGRRLKAILETGELAQAETIVAAAGAALAGGADFLKTSTGKTPVSATAEAVSLMLAVMRQSPRLVGLKPSGGIRHFDDARRYFDMAEAVMGTGWAGPETFRLGASGVLDDLVAVAGQQTRAAAGEGY